MEEIFQQMAIEIDNEFSRLAKIISPDSRGFGREAIIVKFLRNFLPKSFGITRGQIIDSNGNMSNEIDIVIYDALKTPIIYRAGDYRIVPIEGVYAVIFVETFLEQDRFIRLIGTIKNIKNLSKTAFYEQIGAIIHTVHAYDKEFQYFPTLGFIFAYDSAPIVDLGNFFEAKYKEENIPIENQIDFVCVFKNGLIFHGLKNKHQIEIYPNKDCEIFIDANQNRTHNLKNFYLSLNHILTQAWTRPIRFTDYFKPTKELKSNESL